MDIFRKEWRTTVLAVALGLVTLAVFWPVTSYDFVRYDDPIYVKDNLQVVRGITWEGFVWAFTSGHASNWHPVTWLSHMLDTQLFGLRPGWHHFVSLLIHGANAVLLFLLLFRLTTRQGASFVVAALFALHPLHVESVAWIAERKDALSMLFLLLTIGAYAEYARARGATETAGRARNSYILALVFFAMGLMSKPMLVTTPFLLLLLDWWPLNRFPAPPTGKKEISLLVLEKLPFLGLALISSLVTYLVQAQTHAVTMSLPLWPRLANAVVSYVKYLGKTFAPVDLAVFYPHPDTRWPLSEQWPLWAVALCLLALAAISGLAFLRARKQPWLFTGWFWYVGTLVPVIGIIQVGGQAIADRYTYIPLTGIFICVVWSLAELKPLIGNRVLGTAAALALCACALMTSRQVSYWRNDVTLFERALAVTRNNAVAHAHLGVDYGEKGEYDKAIQHFQAAKAAAPALADGYFGLGYTYELQGKLPEALEQYEAALRLKPWDDWVQNRMGLALWKAGRKEEALEHYRRAIRIRPDFVQAHFNLGDALAEMGQPEKAVEHLGQAVNLDPRYEPALLRLGEVLLSLNELQHAAGAFRQLVALNPKLPEAHINLGSALWQAGQVQDAMHQYAIALSLDPAHPVAHFNYATGLFAQNRFAEAAASFTEALRHKPNYPEALTGLGRALLAQGKPDQAMPQFEKALALKDDPFTRFNLGLAQATTGLQGEAIGNFRKTLVARPDWPPALNELAWILATSPDSRFRDGTNALSLALRAAELTQQQNPRVLSTLDAAYAEAGKFQEAIATAEKVRQMAIAAGVKDMAAAADERIKSYRQGIPHREEPTTPPKQ